MNDEAHVSSSQLTGRPRAPARYRVGCAGMFAFGMDYGVHDELDALAAACDGPLGCEVLDTKTGKWIGPYSREDVDDIAARVAARRSET